MDEQAMGANQSAESTAAEMGGEDMSLEMDGLSGWEEDGDIDLFADESDEADAGDDAEEPAEDAATSGAEEEDAAEEPPEEPLVTLKHNRQEVRVSQEELRTLAQKGLDYDRMRERAENNPAVKVMEQYAASSGMTLEAYLNFLQQNYQDNQVAKLVQGGMSEEVARQQVQLQQQLAAQQRQMETQRQVEQQKQAEQAQVDAFIPLVQKYPEANKGLAPEVLESIRQGVPPLFAYEHWLQAQEVAKLKTGLAAQKATEKNRKTTPGSAKGHSSDAVADPFLRELMGD